VTELIKAVIGHVNRNSFSILPFVVMQGEVFSVSGIKNTHRKKFSCAEFEAALKRGEALDITEYKIHIPESFDLQSSLIFIGVELYEKVKSRSRKIKEQLKSLNFHKFGNFGYYLIQRKEDFVSNCLEKWVKDLATQAIIKKDNSLAQIASKLLPGSEYAMASLYFTASDKVKVLTLQSFLTISLGQEKKTEYQLRDQHTEFLMQILEESGVENDRLKKFQDQLITLFVQMYIELQETKQESALLLPEDHFQIPQKSQNLQPHN
jgi:hypothetical protein